MKRIIDINSKKNAFIKENEVWYIIKELVTYIGELSSLGLAHGDLQPKYIFYDNMNSIKVFCPLLYTTF